MKNLRLFPFVNVISIEIRLLMTMDEIQKSEKCVKSVGAYANAYAF